MWTTADNGTLINLEAIRSVSIEVSDDRQWVVVQARWIDGGDRAPIVALIAQEYGGVQPAMEVAQKYVLAIEQQLADGGHFFPLPKITPTEKAD